MFPLPRAGEGEGGGFVIRWLFGGFGPSPPPSPRGGEGDFRAGISNLPFGQKGGRMPRRLYPNDEKGPVYVALFEFKTRSVVGGVGGGGGAGDECFARDVARGNGDA